MTPLPRVDYAALDRYDPGRSSVALDLSDNTNLWGPHPDALERVRSSTADDLARYPTLYADELRSAVADVHGVSMDAVVTGAGSDDLLDSAFRAASSVGGVVAYAAPTFSMVEPFARMNGLSADPVPWSEALADPERLFSSEPDVVYVCSPNNPTGTRAPLHWLRLLARLADQHGSLLVIDEAYADFDDQSMLSEAPSLSRCLVTRTTSKALGLAGLRCGYGVATPDVCLEVDKSRGPYKVSTLAASASAAAIRDESGWMDGVLAECRRERGALITALRERGHGCLDSYANFVLLAAPNGARACSDRLRESGVGVRPFPGLAELGDSLRVTVGPPPAGATFLDALDRVVAGAQP